MKKIFKFIFFLTAIFVVIFFDFQVKKNNILVWLPSYAKQAIGDKFNKKHIDGPTDIMVLFVDHFEPDTDDEINRWVKEYPEAVMNHRDADGRHPQHTWFYSRKNLEWLKKMSSLVYHGYGEVEFRLHHGRDTSESLREKIEDYKDLYSMAGCLVTATKKPKIVYGSIHGMWALDNSRNGDYCGVNDELNVLRDTGSYADFTFPAHSPMQPKIVNRIYYAQDNPAQPKSYNTGIISKVGQSVSNSFMIFEGPLSMSFKHGFMPRVEKPEIEHNAHPANERFDSWVEANTHVLGRPNWIFVKIHTHGAKKASADVFLGKEMDKLYSYIERNYNDGKIYRLHYVSAREAYNIVKAAEDGGDGNAGEYRDYKIAPYINSKVKSDSLYKLLSYDISSTSIQILENKKTEMYFKELILQKISGHFNKIRFQVNGGIGKIFCDGVVGDLSFYLLPEAKRVSVAQGILDDSEETDKYVKVSVAPTGGQVEIEFVYKGM